MKKKQIKKIKNLSLIILELSVVVDIAYHK